MTDILFTKRLFTSSGSGGGGTGSYSDLTNKPKINNVTLSGNKTTHDLLLFEQVTTMPTASSDYANKAVQYLGESTTTEPIYEQGNFYICEENAGTYSWNHLQVEQIATASDFGIVKVDGTTITATDGVISGSITNNVTSTSTTSALSANMGKELQDEIDHLKSIGKFLALWNCATGLAQSNPTTSPRTYNSGDYFIVGTIATGSANNYRPSGTEYVIGQASSVVETETVQKGYIYWFDGSNWNLMQAESGTVTDVQVNGTSVVTNGIGNIPLATSSTLGAVKVDNSSIIANSGVITANKATGNYSVSFVGNPATTTSALNVGANSTAHGWYATAIGCDAVVGDSTNDVRVPGAIQLGRGSNTEAGTFKVGLSTNGTTWNNYTLLDNTGKVPSGTLPIATASALGVVKPDGSTITIDANGVISGSAQGANTSLSNLDSTGEAHFVKPTDYAGTSNAGVIKTNTSYGTSTNSDGVLQAETKTNAEYNNLANTIFIGKGTLENVLTGKGIQRTTVADTTSTTATLSIAQATDYTFSQNLTSLTISSVPADMMNEATVTFTTGSTFTMTLPSSGLTQLGSPVVPGANQKVTMSFWNNFYIIAVVDV